MSDDSKKAIRCGERVQSYKMVMTWTSGEMLGTSKDNKKLMQEKLNMTKLDHEVWSGKPNN